MPRFESVGAGVEVELDAQEADLLRRLLEEMAALLRNNAGPADPVVARLFPPAYPPDQDPEAEADYRRYAGSTLEQDKLEAVLEAIEVLGGSGTATVRVGPDSASMWLALLTDMRLAIGTRLEVDEEKMSAPVDPGDPEAPALSVLHWLGWVQEEVLQGLSGPTGV